MVFDFFVSEFVILLLLLVYEFVEIIFNVDEVFFDVVEVLFLGCFVRGCVVFLSFLLWYLRSFRDGFNLLSLVIV